MPAVSIRVISLPWYVSGVSIASRVVPATGDTITRSCESSLLSKLLFPTFGRPTIAIEIESLPCCVADVIGK